jgi:RNA polymerase sigma-54 factor
MTPESEIFRFRTELQPRLEQKLKLSFQQIQNLDILLLPTLELNDRIYQEIEQNPTLEISEESESSSTEDVQEGNNPVKQIKENSEVSATVVDVLDDDRDYTFRKSSWQREDLSDKKLEAMQNTPDKPESLQDYLHFQFLLMELSEQKKLIGNDIIYNIGDDGYLKASLEDIARTNNTSVALVEEVLKIIQKLDPPGVGARNLTECLLMQLAEDDPNIEFKKILINQYFVQLQPNKLLHLAKILGKSLEKIQKMVEEIKSLNPHPAAGFSSDNIPYITPDVIVNKIDDGSYEIKLQKEPFSSLGINQYYKQMITTKQGDKQTIDFIRQKIKSANFLIQAITLRKVTLRQLAEQILALQHDFFDKGVEHLHPLRMGEVADKLNVHLSTISRIVSNKYMQTPHGLFNMKFFFSTTTETSDGKFYSQPSVLALVKEIVEREDKIHPLRDSQIADELIKKQMKISRRTISKYRQILNIPSYNQRRMLK